MAFSFTRKTIFEVLILIAGAAIAAIGKEQGSPLLLGLGVVIIGTGVLGGGLVVIRRRRLVFLHSDARFMTHAYNGGAAVLWGLLLMLTGLALVAGGIGLALGQQEALKALVMQPGAWLLAGGIALFFTSAAGLLQKITDGEHGGMRILLALPAYVLGALGVLLGAALTGTGAWGLQDPEGLAALGAQLRTAAGTWLGKTI
jgi:hypothetical protein